MSIRFDTLVPADAGALVELELQCFDDPWTRAMYDQELARGSELSVLLAVRDDARLVGALLGALHGDVWHLMNLLVAPDHRRSGIGRRLVDAFLESISGRDGNGVTLEVARSNDAARHLYAVLGFAAVGIRPRYYPVSGDDAVVMWRPPAGAPAEWEPVL